ncbi:MAG TPA: transcription-repair coupling factor [Anaerolineales bacterium]|nr:transcription-repair coupling factor [Anaerolineales bacterium]
MDLSPLAGRLRGITPYRRLLRALRSHTPIGEPLRIPRSARGLLAAALAEDLGRAVLLVTPRPDRSLALQDEIGAWQPSLPVLTFASPTPLFYETEPWGRRTIDERIRVLSDLAVEDRSPGARVILVAARGLTTRTLSPGQFQAHTRTIHRGQEIRFEALVSFILGAGYRPETLVLEPGQFSRRGGILDVWPPSEAAPARLEFFGDEIESIRRFDPTEQRSHETLEQLIMPPAREGIPALIQQAWKRYLPDDPAEAEARLEFLLPMMSPEPATILDYLPDDSILLLDDGAAVEEAVSELEEQAVEQARLLRDSGSWPTRSPEPYLPLDELRESFRERRAIDLGFLSGAEDVPSALEDVFQAGPRFAGELRRLADHLQTLRVAHESAVVVSRQADRLAEVWSAEAEPASVVDALPEQIEAGSVFFVRGSLTDGWVLQGPRERLHLLTDAEVFGWGRPQPRMRHTPAARAPESWFADLSPGDWVVHADFGIGRYVDLVERTLEGVRREYLMLEYADGGQVYVPIHQSDRVTRYVGADGGAVSPSRLGSAEWERAKGDARRAVEGVAQDLLELYARRMTAQGWAFPKDTPWQGELEASFPYEETDDQRLAVQAVKADMELPRPMDRLICGDAGYGKTEVALRAAFKAVLGGKQAAVLVPTTVLAQQHTRTFRQRLAAFPVEVEMLSRFRTRAEVGPILDRLAEGSVDILIGTHRLLQRDVAFKDLGLLIIDEEQRFGVTHKEYLKRMRTEVDVLTLTATPIPRTLYMALTGARDISTINTPPEERLPVRTHVGAYDPRLIRQAVLRELDRGGQVFFVHNRVQTIHGFEQRLARLLPEARLAVAHGQMPENELADVMERFSAGEIDVLVSTSIIESGLDIPNANTLIIDRADTFGLAQLYQLRGRVGRGAARGHAYLFRPTRSRAGDDGLRRLEILAEHTELGAGFTIAMQDLELRGAGEILGTRQHGHIAAIGFHLYTRLLSAAVRHLRQSFSGPLPQAEGLPVDEDPLGVEIDLPLATALPTHYIPDRTLRLRLYRRLAALRREGELLEVRRELEDRFGPPPTEVDNLLYLLRMKILVAEAGADGVTVENGQIHIHLPGADQRYLPGTLGAEIRRSKRGLWIPRAGPWQSRLEELLRTLARPSAGRD